MFFLLRAEAAMILGAWDAHDRDLVAYELYSLGTGRPRPLPWPQLLESWAAMSACPVCGSL